jgi:archaemetzincin
MKPLVPNDAYTMISVTNKDLYPFDSWAWCFGWASYNGRVGSFSFKRYDSEFQGEKNPNRERDWLRRSCEIMCHELGH